MLRKLKKVSKAWKKALEPREEIPDHSSSSFLEANQCEQTTQSAQASSARPPHHRSFAQTHPIPDHTSFPVIQDGQLHLAPGLSFPISTSPLDYSSSSTTSESSIQDEILHSPSHELSLFSSDSEPQPTQRELMMKIMQYNMKLGFGPMMGEETPDSSEGAQLFKDYLRMMNYNTDAEGAASSAFMPHHPTRISNETTVNTPHLQMHHMMDSRFMSELQDSMLRTMDPEKLRDSSFLPFRQMASIVESFQSRVQTPGKPSLESLEHQQKYMRGPRWRLDQISYYHLEHPRDGCIARSMSGLEHDGQTFIAQCRARYEAVGYEILQTAAMGLSRVLDLRNGVQELRQMRSEVELARLRLADNKPAYEVSARDIIETEVPIFVVSYRHCVFNGHWRMSEDQIDELYAILTVLTEGGRVRLWCDQLLPLEFTGNTEAQRWEAVGLVPYTLFPVVALGCQSSFPGGQADARLWMEVERHMGVETLGVISVQGNVRGRPGMDINGHGATLTSRVQRRLVKYVGAQSGVREALLKYARFMIQGVYSSATSSKYGLVKNMKDIALRLLCEEDIQSVIVSRSDGSFADEGLSALKDRKDVVVGNLAATAVQPFQYSRVSLMVQHRPDNCEIFWDGLSEFVDDAKLGESLSICEMPRSYLCSLVEGEEEMLVIGTLHSTPNLYGYLLVRRLGDDPRRGQVLSKLTNVAAESLMGPAGVDKMARNWYSFVFMRKLMHNSGTGMDRMEQISEMKWNADLFTQVEGFKTVELGVDEVLWT